MIFSSWLTYKCFEVYWPQWFCKHFFPSFVVCLSSLIVRLGGECSKVMVKVRSFCLVLFNARLRKQIMQLCCLLLISSALATVIRDTKKVCFTCQCSSLITSEKHALWNNQDVSSGRMITSWEKQTHKLHVNWLEPPHLDGTRHSCSFLA